MNKYVWLIGENLGQTTNNNSYYFWDHVMDKPEDEIEKYFILEKNKKNKNFVKKLPSNKRKHVIWRNSLKHWKYYNLSDMFLVTLSYKDVLPTKLLWKEVKMAIKRPVIYLQHGTLAMKKLGYNGKSYNNNMFRFVLYNKNIREQFSRENHFKDYQLYYGEFHPRYKELVRRYEEYKKDSNLQRQILWFMTWREYFGDNKETKAYIDNIKKILENPKLVKYLKEKNVKLKICLHQFFDMEKKKYLQENISGDYVEIVHPSDVDVMDELAKSERLITDYSSVGFDFTTLNKPVILYQPDIDTYLKGRPLYCTVDELNKHNIKTITGLVNAIINENMELNSFFSDRLPSEVDYNYLKEGKQIDRMYNDFKKYQLNKITFIGYNFYGRGGTVSATRSLAEGLLERGYLVELLSLKKNKNRVEFPDGLNVKAIFRENSKKPKDLIKRLFFYKMDRCKGYFQYDCNKKYLIPYISFALKKKLDKIKSNTVVSTRESIHLYLKDAKSENIKNKIYFFHTSPTVLKEQFKGLIDKLKEVQLENAAFVTDLVRIQYQEELQYQNYDNYVIVGNSLESNATVEKEQIKSVLPKKVYNGIYLVRISKDRIDDLNNLVNFGKYLKDKKIKNIKIDVYGTGDYVEGFKQLLEKEQLDKYITYKGLTTVPAAEIRKHDYLVDFSLNHSFGMTYLEGIFNGKKVFATKNKGSLEVLADIPNSYINSYQELAESIKKLPQVSRKELVENYEKMEKKYSRKETSKEFVDLLK